MKPIHFLIVCFGSFLIAGCQFDPELNTLATETPDDSSSPTAMAISTIAAEESSPTATGTLFPTSTATEAVTPPPTFVVPDVPPETRLAFQCLNIQPGENSEPGLEGTLILDKEVPIDDEHLEHRVVFLDLTAGLIIAEEGGFFPLVSLDHRYVAYYQTELDKQGSIIKRDLIVSDSKGNHVVQISRQEDWIVPKGWADSERLFIGVSPQSAGEGFLEPPAWLIFNPFTGDSQLLKPVFDRFLSRASIPLPGSWGGAVYNQNLTQAVYLRFAGDDEEFFTHGLWDLTSGQLVVSLDQIFQTFSIYNDIYLEPNWAPDGSKFAFVNKMPAEDDTELYVVTSGGEIQQVTNLAPYMYLRDSLSWSPDGRQIATFISPNYRDKGGQLAVIDTLTGDVTNYCLQAPSLQPHRLYPRPPIWSPDGTKLIFDIETFEEDPVLPMIYRLTAVKVILVDIEKGLAWEIAEDMIPVGWMPGTTP